MTERQPEGATQPAEDARYRSGLERWERFGQRLFWAIFGFLVLVWTVILVLAPWRGPLDVVLVSVPLALLLVWKLLGDASRRRTVALPVEPLDAEELQRIRRWGRVEVLTFFGSFGLAAVVALVWLRSGYPFSGALWVALCAVIAAGMVTVHFSGRCPRCGHRVGFDTGLGLQPTCGRCGVRFRGRRPWHSRAPRG